MVQRPFFVRVALIVLNVKKKVSLYGFKKGRVECVGYCIQHILYQFSLHGAVHVAIQNPYKISSRLSALNRLCCTKSRDSLMTSLAHNGVNVGAHSHLV